MRWFYVALLSLPAAIGGWWGVYETVSKHVPAEDGVLPRFYALLALALAGTLAPGVAYLNRRFAPDVFERYRWRFIRQSAWCGMCLSSWAWLQQHREFNFTFAILIAIVFLAVELLCQGLFRGRPQRQAKDGS